jgi:sugar lactone lactonase YvrE
LFDSVFLPLKKGDNELLLLLAEAMGGWGFMGRAGDAIYLDMSLTKLWEVDHRFSWPETVLYDQDRNVLYVSNFNSDGAQFISRVKVNGDIENYEWIQGLARPAGMAVFKDKLFIVERTNLVEVNLPTGQVANRHAVPAPGFLNDIAVDDEGNVYISDGQKAQILKFSGGQFSTWKSGGEFAQVNGLHYSSGKLYAGVSSAASLKSIDLKTGETRTIAKLDPGAIVDGIETDEKGNLLVSDFNGKVFLVSPEGQKSLLLDSTAPKRYCANFAYVPAKKLLIIPSLSDNRVIAYQRSTK